VKWDRYRCLLIREGARAQLISRNLKHLTLDFPHIAAAAKSVTRESVMLGSLADASFARALDHKSHHWHRSPASRVSVFVRHMSHSERKKRGLQSGA
jgi:hypothetical protein